MNLKLRYDAEFDILHLGTAGVEDAAVEIYPGVTLELDAAGAIIGVEMVNAGRLLGPDLAPARQAAAKGGFSGMDYPPALAQWLQPDGKGGYKEYWDLPPDGPETLEQLRQALSPLWSMRQENAQLPA